MRVVQGIYGDPFYAANKRKHNYYVIKIILFSFFRKLVELLKTETVHFVKSVKLVSVYVKPLEPKVLKSETGFTRTNTLPISTVLFMSCTFGVVQCC